MLMNFSKCQHLIQSTPISYIDYSKLIAEIDSAELSREEREVLHNMLYEKYQKLIRLMKLGSQEDLKIRDDELKSIKAKGQRGVVK